MNMNVTQGIYGFFLNIYDGSHIKLRWFKNEDDARQEMQYIESKRRAKILEPIL